MTSRRARRHEPPRRTDLSTAVKNFTTGWSGIISASIFIVVLVLVVGIFRIPLPFTSNTPPETPDPWGSVLVPATGTLRIAYIGNTANGASLDASGAPQAIRQVLKDRPNLKGATLELQTVEDTCNADAAGAKARELAGDATLIAVISGACSQSNLAAEAVFEEKHVTFVALDEHAPELTDNAPQSTFRMSWNRKSQGSAAAATAFTDVGLQRAVAFYDSSPSAELVARDFVTGFRAQTQGTARGQVTDVRQTSAGEVDAAQRLVASLTPDLVFFAGSGTTGASLLQRLVSTGYSGQYLVSTEVRNDSAYQRLGSVLEGTLAVQAELPKGAGYDTWKETYERDNGPIGPLSAEAFDAAQLLLQSADTTAVPKGANVDLGRRRFANVVRVFPYDGVTGRSGFDTKGDRVVNMVQVVRYQGGAYTPVPKKAAPADAGLTASPTASETPGAGTPAASASPAPGTPQAGASASAVASPAGSPTGAASPSTSATPPASATSAASPSAAASPGASPRP